MQQIVAPLTGASGVRITYTDESASELFSKAMCANGLAACDAEVFEAAYQRSGILMRGKYFVHTFDLGDGGTWWIGIWGYTSPAVEWNQTGPILEKIFTSIQYTEAWKTRCKAGAADPGAIARNVISNRQEAEDRAAAGWDEYIKSG